MRYLPMEMSEIMRIMPNGKYAYPFVQISIRVPISLGHRYWSSMQSPNDKTQTYQYHLKTYGKNVNYDDFFSNFTDKGFDPREWVDLFSDAGAQYFVPTTSRYHLMAKLLNHGLLSIVSDLILCRAP